MRKSTMILTAALALVSCVESPKLVIIHSNDVHSHFEPLRPSGDDSVPRGGLIERAAFIDSVRKAEGKDKVLYLSAGDINQGTSYFSEFLGEMEVAEQNLLGLDCMTLGNHEFDNGPEDLAKRLRKLKCPVVCANLDLSPFELGEIVKPFTIVERGGMKIGIIGLAPDLTTNVIRSISSRIPQLDPVEETNKYAELLCGMGCDLIILLSHSGFAEDKEIVARSRGLDLVIGGHSHTFMDDFEKVKDLDGREVPIIQDGCWGLQMGEILVY